MFEFAASMLIIGISVAVVVTGFAIRPVVLTNAQRYGRLDAALRCPYCDTAGSVHSRSVRRNGEVSTPKLVAGELTGGLAFLALGFHRKRAATAFHCANCEKSWER